MSVWEIRGKRKSHNRREMGNLSADELEREKKEVTSRVERDYGDGERSSKVKVGKREREREGERERERREERKATLSIIEKQGYHQQELYVHNKTFLCSLSSSFFSLLLLSVSSTFFSLAWSHHSFTPNDKRDFLLQVMHFFHPVSFGPFSSCQWLKEYETEKREWERGRRKDGRKRKVKEEPKKESGWMMGSSQWCNAPKPAIMRRAFLLLRLLFLSPFSPFFLLSFPSFHALPHLSSFITSRLSLFLVTCFTAIIFTDNQIWKKEGNERNGRIFVWKQRRREWEREGENERGKERREWERREMRKVTCNDWPSWTET